MRLDGIYDLDATPAQLFAAMHDPLILHQAIPRCEAVNRVSQDTLEAKITISARALSASLSPKITFLKEVPHSSMTVQVKGSLLLAKFDAVVELSFEERDRGTRLSYKTDVALPKMIALRFGDTIDSKLDTIARKIFTKMAMLSRNTAKPTS